jgi:hypothetical protein
LPYPTVKSDPWCKKVRPRRGGRRHLWTGDNWLDLTKRAMRDRKLGLNERWGLSEPCVELIRGFNTMLDSE